MSDAPETRMNRGGDFSNIYKRDHFVESGAEVGVASPCLTLFGAEAFEWIADWIVQLIAWIAQLPVRIFSSIFGIDQEKPLDLRADDSPSA